MFKKFRYRVTPILILMGLLLILSACNLGSSTNQQEATLTIESDDLTAFATTTAQAQVVGGVTVFPTITPFAFSTRPVIAPTSIVLVPNNPPPPTFTPAPISIVLVAPLPGNVVSGTVQVVGSASHPNFLQYRLEYATQNNPNNVWFPITGIVQQPVLAGVLGVWSTNTGTTPDGLYQLRLRVFLRDGTQQTTQVGNILIQNQSPTPVPTNTTVPRPIAAFTQNLTTGAAPLIVNFFNQSQGQISSYSWSFGDGGSSSAVHPIYTYRTPGTYTVTLRLTGPGGTSNVSRQISVNSPSAPVASFEPDVVSGQPPLTVVFTNNSTGQITSTEWDFGDGTTSTEQNPSHVFNNTDTYNVILRVTGAGGSSTIIRQITVEDATIPAPVASFDPGTTAIETNDSITFNNTTTGQVTSFLWDFNGDGITDNADISPTHSYSSSGTFDVRLIAIGPGGQTEAVVQITVTDPPNAPTAGFDVNVSSNIAPVTASFIDSTTGDVTDWLWDFGDGRSSTEQNPTITYDTAGTYLVTLTASGPGGSTTTSEIPINVETPLQPPVADFSANPQSGPAPLGVDFSNASNGSQLVYAWDFGDGNTSTDENPTYDYTTDGTYTVTLTVTDPQNQSDSATLDITVSQVVVIAPPAPAFIFSPAPATVNETVNFTDQTIGDVTSYSWDFGDGSGSAEVNPTHAYGAAGTYTISLTATGPGGNETLSQDITINDAAPAPVPGFSISANPATVGDILTFTNTSTSADSYAWDFGDGAGVSNEVNPTYAYSAAGTYIVTLNATGTGGTSSTTQSVTINDAAPAPIPGFTISANPATVSDILTFTNTSTNADSYAWDFGDGAGVSNEVNPTYAYSAAGTYTVTLNATGAGGTSSTTQSVTINDAAPAPVPGFTISANPATVGDILTFTNTSANADSYAWDFGDGAGVSNEVNPTYAYSAAGTYIVTLNATGTGGTSSTTQSVTINDAAPAPVPGFSISANPATVGDILTFTNTSTSADSYAWDFGDGAGVSNEVNPTYAYSAAGTYIVTLNATGTGGTSSTTQSVTINDAAPAPVPGFTISANPATVGDILTFTNTSTNADSYVWDFGDGAGVSNEVNPTYAYGAAGTYIVTLNATGTGGTSSTTQSVTINDAAPAPVPGFTISANPATVGDILTFTNTSTNADSYAWDFGDGAGVSNEVNPTYAYGAAGTYIVTLNATGTGGTSSTTQSVTINDAAPAPVPGFTISANPATVGDILAFTNTSTSADSYAWDFGDGVGVSNEVNPTYAYNVAGTYTVTLNATGTGGTQATSQDVTVNDAAPVAPTGPLLFISNSPGNLDLFVADANGDNPVNITNTAFNETEPVWSPDGTKIAYSSNEFGDSDIFIFDLSSMSATQITTNGANDRQPSWSPDGTQLAFASDRNNLNVNNDVFVVDVSDLNASPFNPTVLLSTTDDEQEPFWSPDGSQIVFMANTGGANNIWIVNIADAGNPVQITFGDAAQSNNQPAWSSNNVIAFTTNRDGNNEIYTINPDGSNELRLTNNGDGLNDRLPNWSPNGSQIYYTSNLATDGSGTASNLNIYVMNADGSGQASVTTAGSDEAIGSIR